MANDGVEYSEWLKVLDEMESNLKRTAQDPEWVASAQREWSEPAKLGPMPLDLAGRARSIADRQQHTIRELEAERAEVGRHLDALRTVPIVARGPRYLDATG